MNWCKEKGVKYNADENDKEKEVAYVLKSLEDSYSVPYKKKVDKFGMLSVGFSTALKTISYESILEGLSYLGKLSSPSLRNLLDKKSEVEEDVDNEELTEI